MTRVRLGLEGFCVSDANVSDRIVHGSFRIHFRALGKDKLHAMSR